MDMRSVTTRRWHGHCGAVPVPIPPNGFSFFRFVNFVLLSILFLSCNSSNAKYKVFFKIMFSVFSVET